MSGLGIGIVGTGSIAQAHLMGVLEHGGARVTAVHDLLTERAEETASRWGIPTVTRSVDELVASDDVDAVIVCTPPAAHAAPAIAALDAGKHVLCEKPFALDPAEAAAMVDAAERSGVFLACASSRYRCSPPQRNAKAMIDNGELGDVYHVRFTMWRLRGRPGHHAFVESRWFLDKAAAGGGVVMDQAVYMLDSALAMLGYPAVTSVLAQMRQCSEEPVPDGILHDVEDHAVLMLECEGGKSALIETAWVANMRDTEGMCILGTKAGLRLDPLTKVGCRETEDGEHSPLPGFGRYRVAEEQVFPVPELASGSFFDVTKQFVDGVLQGRQPITPGTEALAVTRVIEAAYRSASEQRSVTLDALTPVS